LAPRVQSEIGMRFLSRLTILTLMVGAAPATVLPASTFESVLARIEIATSHGTEKSTSFLVHQQRAGDGAILYYLTSARPFRDSAADLRAGIRRIRLIRPGEVPIEIAPADVTLPMGNMLDVAVIRVVGSQANVAPMPMVFDPPSPGQVFVISGFSTQETGLAVPQRVHFAATSLIVGDRDASILAGCGGAPATVEGGVFGLVTDCQQGRGPSIVPLSIVQRFILRNLPGWLVNVSADSQFRVSTRTIAGPLLNVPCDATKSGELEVPFQVPPREFVVNASASFINRRSLRLADITVASFDDKTMKLRFTMTGIPPPSFPAACPQGQALVTVRVDVVTVPHSD
jgi:hypothetical protein